MNQGRFIYHNFNRIICADCGIHFSNSANAVNHNCTLIQTDGKISELSFILDEANKKEIIKTKKHSDSFSDSNVRKDNIDEQA